MRESKKSVNYKLLRVERTIAVYKKNEHEPPVNEIDINIPLEPLQTIIHSNVDDTSFFDGYLLNQIQLSQINKLINNKIDADFESYDYILECTGIYNW